MAYRLLLFLFIALSAHSYATTEQYLRSIPELEKPLKVHIGISVNNITDVNEPQETIDFDGVMYLSWFDYRLSYSPDSMGYPDDYVLGDYSEAPRLM